jgi:transcriptional regulator with XRE-family HTH domain
MPGSSCANPRPSGADAAAFADKLGVSLPYLNQMENNHRPVSASVVLALAQEFGLDVTELTVGEAERMVSDMREALADPVFAKAAPPLADLRLAASNAPALARAFLDLHRAYRQSHERLASLDEALGRDDAGASAPGRRCATSFTIATITSMPSTGRRNISQPAQAPEKTC